jgi:hypothetical protein
VVIANKKENLVFSTTNFQLVGKIPKSVDDDVENYVSVSVSNWIAVGDNKGAIILYDNK